MKMENELIGFLEMFAHYVWTETTTVIDPPLPISTGDWAFSPMVGEKAKAELEEWLRERGFIILRSYIGDDWSLRLLASDGHCYVAIYVARKRYRYVII